MVKNPFKKSQILKKYGLTWESYAELIKKCGNRCSICKEKETSTFKGSVKDLAIDHCHETGVVRGLLCNRCNVMLGMAKDNITVLMNAADYLDRYRVIDEQ